MLDIVRKYNFWTGETINTGFLRKSYLDKITGFLNNRLVKVLMGQRRVGKSYLLRMIIAHLIKKEGVPRKNILYINKDIAALDFINNGEALLQVVEVYRETMKPQGKVYLFLDEVQDIMGWEKVVNSFSQDYTAEYELFITGSNANLLSTELATYLGGRYIALEVFPFGYEEYIGIHGLVKGRDSFLAYLKKGGMPESFNFKVPEMVRNYFLSLKDSIVLKDIVRRHSVRDVYLLERLINFMIDSVGGLFSINKIVNYLKSSGYKVGSDTVGNYIGYLTESYFLHEVERYDIKGKKILGGERKYYLNDLGFRFFLSSSFDIGIGKYLENLVYLDLRRQGYRVYVGKIRDKEIDFIAERDNVKKYIQVYYLLSGEDVVQREFGNLEMVGDNFEKIVVSLDDFSLGNRNGVVHRNAWEFVR
ncbi:MAG: ATP-binding protein [bacterium]|nr:ATP-binding protein [bacterium]